MIINVKFVLIFRLEDENILGIIKKIEMDLKHRQLNKAKYLIEKYLLTSK